MSRSIVLPLATLSVALLPIVAGCGSSGPREAAMVRTPAFDTLLEAGMAVAQVARLDPAGTESRATEVLTEELYGNLLVSAPRMPLVPPDDVQAILEGGGPAALAHVAEVREALAAGQMPSDDDLLRLSRMVQHRFLMLSWVTESVDGGTEAGSVVAPDYEEGRFGGETGATPFERVVGHLEAVVLDLWEKDVVWRAAEEYRTERIYGSGDDVELEVDRARVSGAIRLAVRFGES